MNDTRKYLFLISIDYFRILLKLKNLACLIGDNCIVSKIFQMPMRPGCLLNFQYFTSNDCLHIFNPSDSVIKSSDVPKLDNGANICNPSDHSKAA